MKFLSKAFSSVSLISDLLLYHSFSCPIFYFFFGGGGGVGVGV